MKFYWKMPEGLKPHFERELQKYSDAFEKGELSLAWMHLEHAHILGQPWPREHNHVHWIMLKLGICVKDFREITGQIPRLVFGGIKSFVGKIPVGNTGGANVPPLRPMVIPEDLALLLKMYR